ncbi:MAG: hypothetical protein LC749_18690, partial [Actinobacteria bacterium]|nr:hypothetical protein [Actinomycetota bacterium]
MTTGPAVDRQPHGEPGVVGRAGRDVPGRVEAGEPLALQDLQQLGVDLLPAEPGPLVLGHDLVDEVVGQVPAVLVG